jgi:hypothetical protein
LHLVQRIWSDQRLRFSLACGKAAVKELNRRQIAGREEKQNAVNIDKREENGPNQGSGYLPGPVRRR